ncbi:uncharacterized protein LOC115808654 [Chanos chanos]|uniref:Uncharacterized protein LOC115808654 n=1 Tax=Chanos chanos TaxID=29144 RepID=A0A6J2V143_CHACN|nr:uncharacterized protein LOC115808654 [Chanos chanos]
MRLEMKFLHCFLLCLIHTSATSFTLNGINDLENIKFGKRLPRHGLMLLHWFANNAYYDQQVGFQLNFNPLQEDYGFQIYNNYERVLPVLRDTSEFRYYIGGNLNLLRARTQFPSYVTQSFKKDSHTANIDRIIIKVSDDSPTIAEEVYITQYHERKNYGTTYDPNSTFRIGNTLLTQIRILNEPLEMSDSGELLSNMSSHSRKSPDDPRLNLTTEEFKKLKERHEIALTIFANEGLLWFLALADYDLQYTYMLFMQSWKCSHCFRRTQEDAVTRCDMNNKVQLEVKTTDNGYAKMTWSNIPKNIIDMDGYLYLLKPEEVIYWYKLSEETSGSKDTDIALNPGLRVALMLPRSAPSYSTRDVVWLGPEFDEANGRIPTPVLGQDASLQLYTKDGYACVRLYIKKSFDKWKDEFSQSWVGLYSSDYKRADEYEYYKYVVKFKKSSDSNVNSKYNTYKYETGMTMKPGVQARFFMDSGHNDLKAYTEPWN